MENNFNLKKFLTENKLTTNSKLLKEEDFAPSPNSNVPDTNAEEYDVATAFKKARVDMSKPVMVLHTYGSAAYGGHDEKEMNAEAAIEMLEAERQDRSKQYTDDGEEVPEDHHGYEFANSSIFEKDMPEGHEYKLAYFQLGDADFVITQEKSGVSEIDADLLKRAQNTPAPAKKEKPVDKGLRASMGPNAEQEQKVIDIAKDAIALMDEQPGTSAENALAAVLDI